MNDVGGFLIQNQDASIAKALISYSLDKTKDWDLLELNEFLDQSLEINAGKGTSDKTGVRVTEENNTHYYIPIDKSWDEYYNSLSRKFRKNLRRAERSCSDLGTISLQQYTGNDLTEEHVEAIISVNRYANYPRLYHSQSEQDFLKELLICAPQWLNVYLLCINDKPVAYEYGFLYNSCFEDWRAGFDTRIDPAISIGKFVALKITKKTFDQKLKEIDFMRGEEAYKQDWQPAKREFVNLRIFKTEHIIALASYYWLKIIKPRIKSLQVKVKSKK